MPEKIFDREAYLKVSELMKGVSNEDLREVVSRILNRRVMLIKEFNPSDEILRQVILMQKDVEWLMRQVTH